uniref:translation initiation factor IF-2 n=1 Tax=Callithrix jacchus TaxID=9483 RepID=UPI0023DD536A|nr:translation initiation factor IF-2 [Callithrix jacchus]
MGSGAAPCAFDRLQSVLRLLPGLSPAAAAASKHAHSHGHWQAGPGDSPGPEEPRRRGDPPPACAPLPPPRLGARWSRRESLLMPGEWGEGAGCQDGERRPEAGLTPGPGCGRGSRGPAWPASGPREKGGGSGRGPLRPQPPSRSRGLLRCRFWVAAAQPFRFPLLPTDDHNCSLYFSLHYPVEPSKQRRNRALLLSRPRLPLSPPDSPGGAAGAALGLPEPGVTAR